jgi:ABC-type Fe3+-hydroxamate transport system substrate-binding protein
MKTFLTCALLLGATTAAAAQRSRTVIVIPGQLTQVITDTMGTPYEVPYPAGRVFAALLGALMELKVPLEVKDSAGGRVESGVFHRSGSLGGRQISTYLSCGDGITGPNADSYRVYMHLTAMVEPKGADRSTIRTVLLGGALNVSEGARQPMACESTGRWEIRLHKAVLARAATP